MTQAGAEPRRGMTSADIVRIARKRYPIVLACFVAAVALAAAYSTTQRKVYRAEALIRLDPDPPRPLGNRVEIMQSPSLVFNRKEFYETEYRVMRSLKVTMAVVRALGLQTDREFLRESSLRNEKNVRVEDAAKLLTSRLTIEPVRDSSLAQLRYEDTDPTRCAVITNTIVRTYLAQNMENTATLSSSALEWLNGQVATLRSDLERSELALNDFRQKNNVLSISLEDRHNLLSAELDLLSKERTGLVIKRGGVASRHAGLTSASTKDPLEAGSADFLLSPVLSSLRTTYAEQQRGLEELLANLDEAHPRVAAARARINSTAQSIKTEIANIRTSVSKELRGLDGQIGDLKKREEEIQKQAHELQTFELSFNRLNREKVNNEKIYGLVLERARETNLTRMLNFNNIRVIDEAIVPTTPIRPNTVVDLGLGALAGAVLGILFALLRDVLDNTLKTPADLEEIAGITCLGLLPEIDDKTSRRLQRKLKGVPTERDLIVAQHPESGIAEAARSIRTNLMFMSPDKPHRLLVVTSAMPAEGKTTAALSLATVLAQSGERVLLVDTDLRRPRLHRTFRVPNDAGVSTIVAAHGVVDDCIVKTSVEGLSVLPSGPIPPNPAELLQSERFANLVKELDEKFDRVIFDSPPILPVTDAAILSRLVGSVIVVTRAFRTPKTAARQALRSLADVRANVLGVILNAVDLNRSDYQGYYYYYQRDRYYTQKND